VPLEPELLDVPLEPPLDVVLLDPPDLVLPLERSEFFLSPPLAVEPSHCLTIEQSFSESGQNRLSRDTA
jgi:hypothetical protein